MAEPKQELRWKFHCQYRLRGEVRSIGVAGNNILTDPMETKVWALLSAIRRDTQQTALDRKTYAKIRRAFLKTREEGGWSGFDKKKQKRKKKNG